MKRQMIGFCGIAKSGKDTAGAFASQDGYKRFAFGDKLKEALLALNPAIGLKNGQPVYLRALVNQIGMEQAKHHEEVRKLLQRMGTEVGRETIHPETWINAVVREIKLYESATGGITKYAITDVRFPNEGEWVQSCGGIVVKIIKPDVKPLRDEKGRIHKSELHVLNDEIPVNVTVHNNSTLEDFQIMIKHTITDYEERWSDGDYDGR